MLPKINRLTKDSDFSRVFKQRGAFRESFLLLKMSANNLKATRFGLVVSQKVFKKAVDRNKAKRKLSEAIRARLVRIKTGYDVVLVALRGFGADDLLRVGKTIDAIFKKAKLWDF